MANKTKLTWKHDGKNTDGSPFTEDQFAGFVLEINGAGAVGVPAGWEADGQYEMPLSDLAAVQETGDYTMRMAVVNSAGAQSAWSNAVSFSMDFRVPTAVTALAVG